MGRLKKEEQLMAVEKVLEEMKYAEEYLSKWNACWFEQLLDAYCLPLHYEIGEADVRDLEKKYEPRYKLANAFYSEKSIGIPLAKATLVGNNSLTGERDIEFDCVFGRIDWYGMHSNNSKRNFSFINNGDITFSKDYITKQSKRHPKKISYDTSFNVLKDDFEVDIVIEKEDQEKAPIGRYNHFTVSLNENVIKKKYNNIEITENLSTGEKQIKIVKDFNGIRGYSNGKTALFEATLNKDNSLKNGTLKLYSHKHEKQVNRTYQIDISEENGIRANIYSRKGLKVGETNDPELLSDINTLLFETLNEDNISDRIIINFVNSTLQSINDNQNKEIIPFDSTYYNMDEIKDIESQIDEVLKCIKGELPLKGLEERVDNYFELTQKRDNSKENNKQKKLKLNN